MAQTTTATFSIFDRVRLARIADWLAVGVAVAMPWSISASQILTALWLFALLPTLDIAEMRRELRTAAGGLPVLLWLLALAGMLWANVPGSEGHDGVEGFHQRPAEDTSE